MLQHDLGQHEYPPVHGGKFAHQAVVVVAISM